MELIRLSVSFPIVISRTPANDRRLDVDDHYSSGAGNLPQDPQKYLGPHFAHQAAHCFVPRRDHLGSRSRRRLGSRASGRVLEPNVGCPNWCQAGEKILEIIPQGHRFGSMLCVETVLLREYVILRNFFRTRGEILL